jgi:hypothetical protein
MIDNLKDNKILLELVRYHYPESNNDQVVEKLRKSVINFDYETTSVLLTIEEISIVIKNLSKNFRILDMSAIYADTENIVDQIESNLTSSVYEVFDFTGEK